MFGAPLHIRDAVPDDVDDLLRLERDALGPNWSRAAMLEEMQAPSAVILVAVDPDGRRAGYGHVRVMADEAELLGIVVDPAARGMSLGRSLMDALEARAIAADAARMFLEVRATNQPALALYVGRVYLQVGIRKGYYRDGEDALVLCRDLDEAAPSRPLD